MPKSYDKRYGTDEEGVLSGAIEGLESEKAGKQRGALFTLLLRGPFFCDAALVGEPFDRFWNEDGSLVRAELLAFLRGIIRAKGQGRFSDAMSSYGGVSFAIGLGADGRASCFISNGSIRDIILVQLVTLLQVVGMANVRVCGADCERLFVKTHRREYCSPRCQKRAYMRERRRRAVDAKQKTRARLRRQRA